ncbi:ABC transporter permease [Streptomyces albipurpureus]|uniref:ABC transporter permease n=1 Tax=Streptomyces albipurpureus TaxID=2897419 RepID=A0ABT0UEB8_9ACTN|nr:ABC transporter permease [Streptomyces sp. CWNU-1]MCM2386857.1 ABC transporter permease [Streptomyces sp. CWNU-1]
MTVAEQVRPTALPLTMASAAVRALAWCEARRLLRHPAVLVSLALCLTVWAYPTASGLTEYPVLHEEDQVLQLELLLPAAGVLLASHMAVVRAAREGTAAWLATLVLTPAQRVAAHLLALLPVVALVATLAGIRFCWLALLPGAVSSPSAAELATGPALVLITGALGVLIGTVTRSIAAGPITLVVLGLVTIAEALFGYMASPWRRLDLIDSDFGSGDSLPAELMDRPAELHLLYLLLLTIAFGALALLRSGHRGRVVSGTAVLALVGVIATGAAQLRPLPESVSAARKRAEEAPAALHTCVRKGVVTYCAFPEFIDRHRQWSQITDGIVRRVPDSARPEPITVRQRLAPITTPGPGVVVEARPNRWAEDDRRAGTPGAVSVGTHWGNGSDAADDDVSGYATALARRIIEGPSEANGEAVCGGRGILTVWLAGQATKESESAIRSLLVRHYGMVIGFGGMLETTAVESPDVNLALKLLDRPADEVGEVVERHWDKLTHPATTSAQAARILDVPPPAAIDSTEKSIYSCPH